MEKEKKPGKTMDLVMKVILLQILNKEKGSLFGKMEATTKVVFSTANSKDMVSITLHNKKKLTLEILRKDKWRARAEKYGWMEENI